MSKLYKLGARQERYKTFRDSLTNGLTSALRRLTSGLRSPTSDSLWALKDVSFEVKRGEVVSIMGRNGAGKSTLLKILSRITEPTEGYAEIHGRMGSLLEVGTGFHPELTGRDDIYLNEAILGMKRAEIVRRFDQIVAFAEVENFIDTPVKHYSSGMGLRLGFAVAAHLEPDILVVDEVLAVGDAQFQRKCLGKMQDVAGQSRTVLFVSHNMAAITALCQRALLLQDGEMKNDAVAEVTVSRYLLDARKVLSLDLSTRRDRKGTGVLRFTSCPAACHRSKHRGAFNGQSGRGRPRACACDGVHTAR